MHTAHWLRKLPLSKLQVNELLSTSNAPTLSAELNDLFVTDYSTNQYHIEVCVVLYFDDYNVTHSFYWNDWQRANSTTDSYPTTFHME